MLEVLNLLVKVCRDMLQLMNLKASVDFLLRLAHQPNASEVLWGYLWIFQQVLHSFEAQAIGSWPFGGQSASEGSVRRLLARLRT